MRILHLRASNFYGGPERQLHLHARAARGSSFEIAVGSFLEGGETPEFLRTIADDGIETRVLDVRSAYDPSVVRRLRDCLRDGAFDILCTHEYRSTIVGGLAARGSDVRWIAFSRGFTSENLKIHVYQFLDKRAMRHARRIVAVSEAQKQKLVRAGIRPEQVSVVTNAVDPAMMADAPAVDLRARFGWPDEACVAVSGGRFSREKGQSFLVEAAARALESAPSLRVALFGDGPDRAGLQARIAELGLEDRILLPGFERNMAGVLKGSDLLVNPSLSEGMPNIVLEAMALATPVLATAVGGVPELIDDRRTGLLVPEGDADALAAGLVTAASDPAAARERAVCAFDVVSAEHGFARQFDRLRQIYEDVLDG